MDIRENKKKIVAQLICLLLSIGLWFYINSIENPLKFYELNRVPVQLLNTDILKDLNLALAPNQNLYVTLKLEGTSQQLFGIDRSDFKVTADLSEYALKEGQIRLSVKIVNELSNVTIKNDNNLGVIIKLEKLIEKEVPLNSEINIISKANYYGSTPTFKPETLVVSGAESLVNQVIDVVVRGQEDNVSSTIVKDYKVIPVDEYGNTIEGVQLSSNWVEVSINVGEGKQIPIKVVTDGTLITGLRIKSIKAHIDTIGVTGPQDILDKVSEITTSAIDLSNIEDSITVKATLNIPDGLYVYDGSNNIDVDIEVEKAITKEFTLKYTIEGKNSELLVTPESDTVPVKVSGYNDVLSKITEANFNVVLNVSEYKEAGEYTKEPTVTLINADGVTIDSIGAVKIQITKDTTTNSEIQGEIINESNI